MDGSKGVHDPDSNAQITAGSGSISIHSDKHCKKTEEVDFLLQAMIAIVGMDKTKKILVHAEEIKREVYATLNKD